MTENNPFAGNPEEEETVLISKTSGIKQPGTNLAPYLVEISGGQTGRMYKLTTFPVRIGRSVQCEIAHDDPHISRIHAEVVEGFGSDIIVRDLGSANGILVNETKLAKHDQYVLKNGDKIQIGAGLCLKFCYQDLHDESFQRNLFKAANIDSLTQLYNKKYFLDVLERELSFTRRTQQPLSLLMLDVDFFKRINDKYGHLCGDEVLRSIGLLLQETVRSENVACRYGGEEFAVILRNTPTDQALRAAERLRRDVEAREIHHQGNTIQVTVSIGLATTSTGVVGGIDEFVNAADQRLYQAKTEGRNRVVN